MTAQIAQTSSDSNNGISLTKTPQERAMRALASVLAVGLLTVIGMMICATIQNLEPLHFMGAVISTNPLPFGIGLGILILGGLIYTLSGSKLPGHSAAHPSAALLIPSARVALALPAPTPSMSSQSSPSASSSSSSAPISFTASDDFAPSMTYSEFVGSIDDEPDCPREQSRLTGKTSVEGEAWIYTKNSSISDKSQLDKFHLSIARDDIERCFPLVFPLTRKFKTNFKVLRRSEFSESDINSNAWGKEFVFYVPKANTPGFLADIMPIIQSFGRLTPPIRRSLTPLADAQVKGSDGYLYHRDDHSITGRYVEATLFRNHDFTLSESSQISCTTDSIEIEAPHVPRRQTPCSRLSQEAAYLHADAGYFFERCLSPRNKIASTIQGWMMRPLEWHGFTLKKGFLDHYLDSARAIIDTICSQIDPKKQWEKHRFAEVTPSIYYDFIVPLYRGILDEGWNIDTFDIRRPFQHRPDLEKRLIQNIVLCSFRETGVQDQSLSPQYISIVRNNWTKFNTLVAQLT